MSKKSMKLVALLMSMLMVLSFSLTAMAAESPIDVRIQFEEASGEAIGAANTEVRRTDKTYDDITYVTAGAPVVCNVVLYVNGQPIETTDPVSPLFTEGIKPDTLYLVLHQKADGSWEKFFVMSGSDGTLSVTLAGVGTVAVAELKVQKKVTEVFVDVDENDWWEPGVQVVYDNEAMIGTGDGDTFDPTGTLTRDQFVQVLYSVEGKPGVTGTTAFTDVKDNGWYRDAVIWASQFGVTAGKSSTFFGVNQSITRQEMILMLYRYAQLKGLDTSATAGCLDRFTDADKVSAWAKAAMEWAVTQGIISGTGDGRLNAQGAATRAECAVMVAKLLSK